VFVGYPSRDCSVCKGNTYYFCSEERKQNSSADPLVDISNTRKIDSVVVDGNRYTSRMVGKRNYPQTGFAEINGDLPQADFWGGTTNGMVRRLYAASSWGIRGERRRHPMELHTIGIDLGKTVFHLVGLNLRGEVVVRKKFSRKQLLHFTANLQVRLIGMEACGGSHFLGRALREQGSAAHGDTLVLSHGRIA
jgi:hypothetical protein